MEEGAVQALAETLYGAQVDGAYSAVTALSNLSISEPSALHLIAETRGPQLVMRMLGAVSRWAFLTLVRQKQ